MYIMNYKNWLHLLSDNAKLLWFKNMKNTLDKIIKIDLNLSKELEQEINKISDSLWIIINKNIHSKKIRLDVKLKADAEEINCDNVSTLLVKSNELLLELLWNDNKDEIKWEIELSEEIVLENKLLAWKSNKNKSEYVESIRYKNELKKRLEKIILLEEVIYEINNFREKLIWLLLKNETKKIVNTNKNIKPKEDYKGVNNEEFKKETITEKGNKIIKEETDSDELNDVNQNKLFNFDELESIKSNLKNKKIELTKQNSLYHNVKEYFSDESRLTFYHLGLYKLIRWFNENKVLDIYNTKNIIWLIDVNSLCKFFIQWRFWDSNEVKLSIIWMIFKNSIRLKEKYLGLWKALYYDLLKTNWRWTVNDINIEYSKFLKISDKKDEEIESLELEQINFLDINESNEVKEKLEKLHENETSDIKRVKLRSVRKVKSKNIDTIQELITKKKKITKSYNIDKYNKIFLNINIQQFKDFFDIDKDYFLKVWSTEVVDLYLSALVRLEWDFDNDYFNKIKLFLEQYKILINNWVKKIASPVIDDNKKEILLFQTWIKLHLDNFAKEWLINDIFKKYLEKNINNKEFNKQLVFILKWYWESFINEFIGELELLYDVNQIKEHLL